MGVSLKDAMHQTYLWAWASLVRTKILDVTFKDFRDLVIRVDAPKSDSPDASVPVDPTQPAASAG
jgi:hypothetical protein